MTNEDEVTERHGDVCHLSVGEETDFRFVQIHPLLNMRLVILYAGDSRRSRNYVLVNTISQKLLDGNSSNLAKTFRWTKG